ncbi:MAG: response regulator transcription factor [Bacteroidales bacterium]|nr:response regulator transcription factor [Bacteroidales bacterium]
MAKINLAIINDEELLVELLQSFFKKTETISVVITATNGDEFLLKLATNKLRPDIILLDFRFKQTNTLEKIKDLKQDFPDIKIIVISSYYKKSLMGYMLKSGVNAFIPKGISPDKLVNIIMEVAEKDYYFMEDQINILRKQLSSKIPQPSLYEEIQLSDREKEVLYLICQQKTAKDISEIMCISKRTVDGHRTNLLLKTGAKNTAGLVIYAILNKIIDPIKQITL